MPFACTCGRSASIIGTRTSVVGAIRNQSAPVLVYSVDGQRVIQGSVITPDLEAEVRALPSVGSVGQISQGTFTATTAVDVFDDINRQIQRFLLVQVVTSVIVSDPESASFTACRSL